MILALNQHSQINSDNILDLGSSYIFQDFAKNENYETNEQIFQDADNAYPEFNQQFEEYIEDIETVPTEVSFEDNLPIPRNFEKGIFSPTELIVKLLQIHPPFFFSTNGDDYKK